MVFGELLLETLPKYLSGEIQLQTQPEEGVTYAPMLNKTDGLLDFSLPADELVRKVRAFNPWPGTYFEFEGQPLKVHAAHREDGKGQPGQRVIHQGLPAVVTTNGLLVLDQVQPAGKKPMPGKAFLAGARNR